jgi:hypothetical protein
MKKIRLLQIAIYIAFAALFLQDAAPAAYKGFIEGYNDGYDHAHNANSPTAVKTMLLPSVTIDPAALIAVKNDKVLVNKDYSLENVSISADIRVKDDLAQPPWWFITAQVIVVLTILYLLFKIAYIINNIIYNIYRGTMFRAEVIKPMRKMGILLILYFVADYIFEQLSYLESSMLINSPFKTLNTSAFNFEALICGLLVLIIADAFKEAVQLKEEQELTI